MRTVIAKRLVKGKPALDVPYSEVWEAAQKAEPRIRIWVADELLTLYASPKDLLKNAVVTRGRLTIQENRLSKDAPTSADVQMRRIMFRKEQGGSPCSR